MKKIELDIDNIKSKISHYGFDEFAMFEKDILKGQKILIVMLWSKDLDPLENKYIHKDYLLKAFPKMISVSKNVWIIMG